MGGGEGGETARTEVQAEGDSIKQRLQPQLKQPSLKQPMQPNKSLAWDASAICNNNPAWGGHGGHKTGDDYPAAPNIDHTQV